MSNHSDHNHSGDANDSLKATAAAKRENAEPVEGNQVLPPWLLLIFAGIICFAGVYFGIYHGGFDGSVYNESESTPELLSSKKAGSAGMVQAAVELSLVEQGKAIYSNCQPCHQASGLGVAGQFPPLVATDYVIGSEKRLVSILLKGLGGPITVGGATYNGAMPAWEKALSDKKIAAVASYVRATWGNSAPEISEAKVAALKKQLADRSAPWTEAELLAIPADAAIEGAQEAAAPATGAAAAPAQGSAAPAKPATAAVDIEAGKAQYMAICVACHQPTGLGLFPVFPPLVNSEYVKGNPERLVAIILSGVMGPITVDGKAYNNMMPPQGAVLTDTKISQVASYVRSAFGEGASPITVEQVAEARKKHGTRATAWTEAELKAFAE
jgi:mono/diheme cytochrome c family protein